jgi:hypothetical protein
MTLTNVTPSPKGAGGRRATKFTPQAIEKIKDLVAQGVSREDIAKALDVTLGSLQVTCSKLGISLRRKGFQNGSARHTLDVRGRTIPAPGSVVIAHVRAKTEEASQTAAHTAPLAKFAITMRHRGRAVASDIPLTAREIEQLALRAMSRDLGVAELMGELLAAAIKKDKIDEILRDKDPPFAA